MVELHEQGFFDEEGHIDYDKVVEQINSNLKNLLHTCLQECFSLAKDNNFRLQITETSSQIRDEAFDSFLDRQHVVASEFYVEVESRFYTSSSVIARARAIDQSQVRSIETGIIELTLAVDNLINRSEERHKESLEELELRLQELSHLAHLNFNVRCMHPQDFYPLFQKAIAPLNISADGKILLCKLLYQQISPKLSGFYAEINQFLIDMEILPSTESIQEVKTIDSFLEPTDAENNSALDSSEMRISTGQFFAPVEQEFWEPDGSQVHAKAQEPSSQILEKDYDEVQGEKISKEFESIAMDVYGPGHSGLDQNTVSLILQPYSPDNRSESSPAQRRQFVYALSTVQRVEAASDAIFKADQIKTAVRRTLHEKGALDAVEIVNNEEKVIDFVSTIFQVILDDDTLCDAIKALLAKLQISVIKLALVDFTFFQNPKHPARRLLNRLTSIGIGVTGKEELLFNKLKSVVHLITENFETDVHIFEIALSEVQKLDIYSLEQAREAEEKAQIKAKTKAKRSSAKRVVIHTIKKYLKDKELPNLMIEFCLKCWAPHMGIIYMKHGKKSKDWRTSVRTLRRVIEVSQGAHSLYDVRQYIKKPNEFFNYIRSELEYLSSKKQEFDEIIESAEIWYLTHLRDIEQEAKDLETLNEENTDQTKTTDNVVHLFKNLSTTTEATQVSEELIQNKPANVNESKIEFEAKALAEAKAKAETEAKALAEAKAKVEAEARALAEAKAKAEVEARALAEAKSKAEVEARDLAEAKTKADAEAKALAETKAEAEVKALAEAKTKAEAEARDLAKTKAKAEAEAKALAEAKAKIEAEARDLAEAKAKVEAEARDLAEAKAKADAEAKAEHENEIEDELIQDEVSEEIVANENYKEQPIDEFSIIENEEDWLSHTTTTESEPEEIVIESEAVLEVEDTQAINSEAEDIIEDAGVPRFTLDDLPENVVPGAWLEIYQGTAKAKRRLKFSTTLEDTDCLLFTDRSGDYTLEIDIQTFMDDLDAGRTRLINESNRFDLALSSVISNIRDGHSKASN